MTDAYQKLCDDMAKFCGGRIVGVQKNFTVDYFYEFSPKSPFEKISIPVKDWRPFEKAEQGYIVLMKLSNYPISIDYCFNKIADSLKEYGAVAIMEKFWMTICLAAQKVHLS